MSIKKTVHRYYADSLRQILDVVDMIGKEYKENGQLKPLWFRGHEYTCLLYTSPSPRDM